ncbi:MAG: fructose-bisphosphatase class III [Collinsella aerofaciens]
MFHGRIRSQPARLRYLRLLSRQFPTEQSAFTEIINLSAILNLPKGTEHFMSGRAW